MNRDPLYRMNVAMRSLRMEWLERHRKVALKQRVKKRKKKKWKVFLVENTFKDPNVQHFKESVGIYGDRNEMEIEICVFVLA